MLFLKYHQPKGNLSGLISIPIILAAPAALQPITAESPTPPSPHTATLDPGFTYKKNKKNSELLKMRRNHHQGSI